MLVSSDVPAPWIAVAGLVILAFTLREIFKDLFNPSARGTLSGVVARTTFRMGRLIRPLLPVAGPLALVLVMMCWAFLIACGFALVYWAGFPGDFRFQIPQDQHQGGFGTMLYFSLEVLTTLGLGDITPLSGWTRAAAVLEALIGLALVTASVSWIVLLYPALARLRTLARRVSTLVKAGQQTGLDVMSEDVEHVLAELALDLIRTRVDFIHFPIIYYFHSDTMDASLPRALQLLSNFAQAGTEQKDDKRLRLASAALSTALAELASLLADKFGRGDASDTDAVLAAYAEDHLLKGG